MRLLQTERLTSLITVLSPKKELLTTNDSVRDSIKNIKNNNETPLKGEKSSLPMIIESPH